MASAMRVMIILVIILGVSVSVQARNFPNNHHSGAAMKVIQIAGVSPHAHDWFISIIYGDYKYVTSANIVGRPEQSPPPSPKSPPGKLPANIVGRPEQSPPPSPASPPGNLPIARKSPPSSGLKSEY